MSAPRREGSSLIPSWTALSTHSSSVAPSEGESIGASQEMRDELMQSPPRPPLPRKRKSSNTEPEGPGPSKKPRKGLEPLDFLSSDDDDFPPPPPRRKPRDSLNHPLSRPPLRPETISQPGSSNVAGSFNPIRPFISHRPVMTAPVASSPKRPASGASGSSSSGPSERPLNVARKSTGVQRLKGPREKLSSPALGSSSKLPAGKTPKESHAPSARSRDNAQKPSSSGSDDFPHVRDILRKSISTQPRKLSTPVASSSKVPSVSAQQRKSTDAPRKHTQIVYELDKDTRSAPRPKGTLPERRQNERAPPPEDVDFIEISDTEPPPKFKNDADHPIEISDTSDDEGPPPAPSVSTVPARVATSHRSPSSPVPETPSPVADPENVPPDNERPFFDSPDPDTGDKDDVLPNLHANRAGSSGTDEDIAQDDDENSDSPHVDGIVPEMNDLGLASAPATSPSDSASEPGEAAVSHMADDTASLTLQETPRARKTGLVTGVSSQEWTFRDGSGPVSGSVSGLVSSTSSSPPARDGGVSSASSRLSARPPSSSSSAYSLPSAGTPPVSSGESAAASPSRVRVRPPIPNVRIASALYNGPDGFFGAVHRRRSSGNATQSQAQANPPPAAAASHDERQPPSPVHVAARTLSPSPPLPPPPPPALTPPDSGDEMSVDSDHVERPASQEAHIPADRPLPTLPLPTLPLPTLPGQPVTVSKSTDGADKDTRSTPSDGGSSSGSSRQTDREIRIARAINVAKLLNAQAENRVIDLTLDSDDEAGDTSEPVPANQRPLTMEDTLVSIAASLTTEDPFAEPANEQGEVVSSSGNVPDLQISEDEDLEQDIPFESMDIDVPLFSTSDADTSGDVAQIQDVERAPRDPAAHELFQEPPQAEQSVDESEDDEQQCEDLLYEKMRFDSGTPDTMASYSPSQLQTPARRLPPRRVTRSVSSSASSTSLAELPLVLQTRPRITRPGSTDSQQQRDMTVRLDTDDDGIEILTWTQDGVSLAKEYADFYKLAKDIPHDLQDLINNMNNLSRRGDNMQLTIFESMMSENTAVDEPGAPDIKIINHIDDELTPPFEFHYSNLMWHGEGVPKPDLLALKGCGCRGESCDPNSKTCLCVLRQQEYTKHDPGFAYDMRGRLRSNFHEFPIFECNRFCGCGDECRNRVVQHGRKVRVNIQKTRHKGWGIFAGERIPAHTFVGIYAGEYLTNDEGHVRGMLYDEIRA